MTQQETVVPDAPVEPGEAADPAAPVEPAETPPGDDGSAGRVRPPLPRPRRLWGEGLAVYVVGQLLVFWYLPALGDRGQSFFQDVLVNAMGPDRHGMSRLWRDGVFPTWVRTTYGGEPYLANVQHGVLYPGNLPFWIFSTSTALDVMIAVHLAFAVVSMWAYCRIALRTGMWASILGAVCFGFGANVLAHSTLGDQFQVICLMPLVMLTAHLALERRRLRWTVLCAVAIGLQFLAGHAEEWLYVTAALMAYGIMWALFAGPAKELPRRIVQAGLSLGGAVVLFVLLFSWQLLPTLQLKGLGYRSSPSFTEQYPLPKASGVNALLPDFGRVLIGENIAFVGTVALALVGLAIVARRRDLAWVRVWIVVAGGLGFVMALGLTTGFYRFLYDNVSLIKSFRVPSRYLLITSFALAAGAAIGLDELLNSHVGRFRARLVQGAAAVGVLAVGGVVAVVLADVTNDSRSWKWWVLAAAAGLLAWLLASVRWLPRAPIAIALVALTVVELHQARPLAEFRQRVPNVIYNSYGAALDRIGADGNRYVSIAGKPVDAPQAATIPIPPGITGQRAQYYLAGVAQRLSGTPDSNLGPGADTILGRDGGLVPLRTYRDFYYAAVRGGGNLNAGAVSTPPSKWNWKALDFLSVTWFMTSDELPASERAVLAAHGFTITAKDTYVLSWRRTPPPLARVVHAVDVIPGDDAQVRALSGSYDLTGRAIVSAPVTVDPTATGSATTTRVGERSVDITATSTGGPSLLTIADPAYPGWRVSVDGKDATALTVDHAFRGVVIPAGTHTVRWYYVADKFRLGVGIGGITLLLIIAAGIAAPVVRRRRRQGEPADDPAELEPVPTVGGDTAVAEPVPDEPPGSGPGPRRT